MPKQRQKAPNEYKLVAYISPISSVSEGTKVWLDGSKTYYRLSKDSAQAEATREIKEKEDGISYFWKQIGGPKVTLENQNTATPSFIAPRVDINDTYNSDPKISTTLEFQLIVKDKEGISSEPVSEQVIVKLVQRALILQGGGALGAYEVGVVKALVENIIKKKDEKDDNNNNDNSRPLFDIVAGTSIGAVNAAIMIGTIIKLQKEKSNLEQEEIWKSAIKEVERFWEEISDPLTIIPEWIRNNNPLYESWLKNWKFISKFNSSLFDTWWHSVRAFRQVWNQYYESFSNGVNRPRDTGILSYWYKGAYYYYIPILTHEWPYIKWISSNENWKEEMPYIQSYFYWPENYSALATVEALRRYYSVANSLMFGVPKVLTPSIPQPDTKFFGLSFTRMDNTPLARTIKKYWDYEKFPIKTSFKDLQPRLLLISVDTLDATSAVAFDSYVQENGICKTEYGDEEYKHVVEYPEGLTIDHVMASMAVHFKHRYPKMKVKSSIAGGEVEKEELRYFWDGGYLSNTPLREVLYGHRHYWSKVKNQEIKLENGRKEIVVPDIEVYIVDLYPPIENELPMDADAIQDREMDIQLHNRTKLDVRYAEIATDYIEFIEQLESLARKYSEQDEDFKQAFNHLLDKVTRSKTRIDMKPRTYRDLIEARFDITKVVYIERSDDGNTIFGKTTEFSSKTVNQLKEEGYQDAQTAIEIETLKEIVIRLVNKGIISREEGVSTQQNLQKAIIHARHQNMDKAIEWLNRLIKYAKDITVVPQKCLDKAILQFVNSASKLKVQLMINKITVMVNKDIITEDKGDKLKQKLQSIKSSIKDQNTSSSINENTDIMLQQFIKEVNSLDIEKHSSQLSFAANQE